MKYSMSRELDDEDEQYSEEDLNDMDFSREIKVNLLEETRRVFDIDTIQTKTEGESTKVRGKTVGSDEFDYYILLLDPES